MLKESQKLNLLKINISGKEQMLRYKKKDWKKFKENNVTTALTVFFAKKKKYILLYIRHKSNREKQVILLMISNGEKWQYLAFKKLSAL